MAAADLGKLFGKDSAFYQLFVWQVMAQFIATVGEPGIMALQQLVLSHAPVTPLSVAEAVDAALRGHLSVELAQAEALLSGTSAERFRILLSSAGAAPAPEELTVALRRGLIPEKGTGPDSVSFEQGIRETRLNNKWTDLMRALAVQEPTPTDALDALLEGQIEDAEARELYQRFGGDPAHFTMLFNTRGSAPTPLEAIEMANRGVIPWEGTGPDATSYQQAFLEGPWRNKWAGPYRKLGEYVAPPRTVTALIRSGALSDEQGLAEFKKSGMTQEMAEAMLRDAHSSKLKADKDLAKADVLALYQDRIISRELAGQMLEALDWSPEQAGWLLAMVDVRRVVAAQSAAIGRIHTLYVTRKIDRSAAVTALDALQVPPDQRDDLLATWDIERTSNVKVLTSAEIANAFFYKIIDQGTATAELVDQGYTPFDAWMILSVRVHDKLPNRPARGPAA